VSKPTAVYLLYNSADELLYIGVTDRGQRRQTEHHRSKAWASEIHRTEWEHFDTRDAALAREVELIAERKPRENVYRGTRLNSGKLLARMEPALHAELKMRAAEQGVSLNQLCLALLAGGIGFKLDD
jgi:predicted GIY-YIG superfamily endonuclease